MSKLKLPIIIAVVLAAAGAGLVFSGLLGGGDDAHAKKHVVEPVTLTPPDGSFIVNLADPDENVYLSFNVALELEPMDAEHFAAYSGGGGGHGGGEAPGPPKVAAYPKFHDAVIDVASRFNSATLKTEDGKKELEKRLLDRFHEIAEVDENALKGSAGADDPAHVGPPYHVLDVDFPKYVIQ